MIAALAFGLGLSLIGCESANDDDPVRELRSQAKISCGGPTELPCPAGLECVDDPGDSCDPDETSAACPGMCVKPTGPKLCDPDDPKRFYVADDPQICMLVFFVCEPGTEYFFDACGCGCEQTH